MTVVSNTTPLNYLILIGQADILHKLYELVLIPEAVFNELSTASTPQLVREWIATKPSWLELRKASAAPLGELEEIQIGERQAIALAQVVHPEFVLLDDRRAGEIAKQLGLQVIGALGILARAAQLGLLDLTDALERLRRTNFRISPDLLDSLLTKDDKSP